MRDSGGFSKECLLDGFCEILRHEKGYVHRVVQKSVENLSRLNHDKPRLNFTFLKGHGGLWRLNRGLRDFCD